MGSSCPSPVSDVKANDLSFGITLHHLLILIALPFVALTAIFCLWLIFKHLHRYTRPAEQRQIIRLIFTPVVFSVLYFISLVIYASDDYISPFPKLYEAFALASLFLLYVHYTNGPTGLDDDGSLPAKNGGDFGGVDIPDRIWILVFQHPFVKTILTIAEVASTAAGTYCADSRSPKYGHIWITIIDNASLVLCFLAILRFYQTHKAAMSVHSPLLKLLSFKLIVGLLFLQSLVFNFISIPSGLSHDGKLAPRDIKYGIPDALVCVEMLFFSAGFHLAFRSREYHPEFEAGVVGKPPVLRKGMCGAALDALNPTDLFKGIAHAFALLAKGRAGGGGGGGGGAGRGRRAGRGPPRRPTGQQHQRLESQDRLVEGQYYGMADRTAAPAAAAYAGAGAGGAEPRYDPPPRYPQDSHSPAPEWRR